MVNSVRLTISSPTKTFVHTILGDSIIKIGRSLNCDFSIPLEDLSRQHCVLEVRNNHFYITDLGSKNGISIDRQPIQPNMVVEVTTESRIVLANIYVLKISIIEVRSKADIGQNSQNLSGPVKVNREKETLSFQLEFPDQVSKSPLPKSALKKIKQEKTPSEKQEASSEKIKLLLSFIIVALILAYYLSKSN